MIPWSGAGGGGGGATAIAKNGTIVGVAGGGPGGGGGGNFSSGQPTQGYVSSGRFAGGNGQNKGGGAWYATGNEAPYAWCDFIATYGIWQGDIYSAGAYTYSTTINFPVSGNYTFNISIDNYGSLSLDSSTVVSTDSYSTVTSAVRYVSAGFHTVTIIGTNTGGPAAMAGQIINPDSSELWNTLSAVDGGPQDGGGSGAGGGGYYGGAGGALAGGDNGAYSGSYGADLIPPAGTASTSYSSPTVIIQGTW